MNTFSRIFLIGSCLYFISSVYSSFANATEMVKPKATLYAQHKDKKAKDDKAPAKPKVPPQKAIKPPTPSSPPPPPPPAEKPGEPALPPSHQD